MDDRVAKLHYRLDGVDITVTIAPGSFCDVGRDAASRLRLDHDDVTASRRHAIIRADENGRCTLVPVSNTAATMRNGRPVSAEISLVDGDLIAIGKTLLRFETSVTITPPSTDQANGATVVMLKDRLVTVLVIDIRGYSVLAQEIGEAEIGKLLRRFNAEAGHILEGFEAYQPRYLGDAVMASWLHGSADDTAVIELADLGRVVSAYQALAAMAARINADIVLPRPLSIGGGINSGRAAFGNLGNAGKIDINTVGEAVNRAFRLESATRTHNADLVIGRASFDLLNGSFPYQEEFPIKKVDLKGYAEPQEAIILRGEEITRLSERLNGVIPWTSVPSDSTPPREPAIPTSSSAAPASTSSIFSLAKKIFRSRKSI